MRFLGLVRVAKKRRILFVVSAVVPFSWHAGGVASANDDPDPVPPATPTKHRGQSPTVPGSNASPLSTPDLDVALGGNCPVSYQTEGKAVKGDPANRLRFSGEIYYLSSKENLDQFAADPERYVPRIGGWCAMALGGPYGNRFEGDPGVFVVDQGRLYLFSSERARNAYLARPEGVLEKAEELYMTPNLKGFCPVSLFRDKAAVPGDRRFAATYKRAVYLLTSKEAKGAFVQDPERYLPRYNGYCALKMAQNDVQYGSPEMFSVLAGGVYLFSSQEAKESFNSNPAEYIAKADEHWAEVLRKAAERRSNVSKP